MIHRPTRAELEAARGQTIADVIAPGLDVLFCGINPGLYSGATGHHFARPGNRFWPALHVAGFTPRRMFPFEERELLGLGLGITNIVARTTAVASELTPEEQRSGAVVLEKKVCEYEPRYLAVLGLTTYRLAFHRKDARVGPQEERICGTKVWLLPNPSGLNAHYQLADLAAEFRRLWRATTSDAGP